MEDKACTAVTAYFTKIEIQWRKLLQQMASIFSRIFSNRFAQVLYIFDAEKKSTYLRALKAIHRYFKPMSETKI